MIHRWKGGLGGLLPHGTFRRSVSVLAGGTAIGQILTMLAAPLLSRLYSVQDFGHFQVYTSILAFLVVVAAWRFELAILLPEKHQTAVALVVLALGIVALMSLGVAGAIWIVASGHLWTGKIGPLRGYLWLMAISLAGAGGYLVLSSWAFRQKAYHQVAAARVAQSGTQVTTQLIAAAAFGFGLPGLLLGDALGRATGALSLGYTAWRRWWREFLTVRWSGMWQSAVRYRRFPLISTGSALINTGGFALPSLMLAGLYNTQVLGWFALVDRVMGVPSTLIGQAVSQVYMSEAARLAPTEPEAVMVLFRRTFRRLAWIGVLPCILLFSLGPMIFEVVFGAPWREAGAYAQLLSVMYYIGFVASPLTPTLNILEHQTWQFFWDCGRIILTVGGLWFVHHLGSPARVAIVSYGVTMAVGYIAHVYISHLAIRRRVSCAAVPETKPAVGQTS